MSIARETHTSQQLTTGGPEMKAAYIVVYDEKIDVEYVPIIGWLRVCTHFDDGTTSDEIVPAVVNPEFNILGTLEEVHGSSSNVEIIGIFRVDEHPDNDTLDAALNSLLEKLRRDWGRAEKYAPAIRDMNRKMAEKWAKVVSEAVAS